MNSKLVEILGYSEEELIGTSIMDFIFEEDRIAFNKKCERLKTGNSDRFELRIRSKSNEEVWTSINASPLMENEVYVGSLGMISDITEQKRKESKLFIQEQRYRSLFEDSPVPIWDEDFSLVKKYIDALKANGVKDIRKHFETNIDSVNECSALLKVNDINQAVLDLNEAPSKKYMLDNFPKLINSRSAEYAINQFEAIANGEKSCEFDAELKTFKGTLVHVNLKWTVVKGYEDTYEKVYLSTTDLTDRIITENTTLKQSNHQKELLLKEIHHRVKNNLQIITSLLKLQSISINNPETAQLFELSLHRINSMALVHDLLYRSEDFSQIDYGTYLKMLIEPLIESMKRPNIAVELDISVKDISLNINTSIPLGLLINEIITNSLKHGFAENENGHIYIRLKANKYPKFTLEIGDNGMGFKKNHDFENSETLGLLLISSLAEQLGGSIKRLHPETGTHYQIRFQELTQNSPAEL